jgi:hypothetical protein
MTNDPASSGTGDFDRPGVVARLTWQAPDPAGLAADLGHGLGLVAGPEPGPDGTFRWPLGGAVLEIVPWRREGPGDEPQAGGRLVLEPIRSEPGEPRPPGSTAARASDVPLTLAGIGWATVDLARAAQELGPWLRDDPAATVERHGRSDGEEPHLGARTRVRATNGLPGDVLVLAEPTTEGRLAASLARHDEGPVALYLRPRMGLRAWVAEARRRGVPVSARRDGPLGAQVLVLTATGTRSTGARGGGAATSGTAGTTSAGALAGPHLIVVEGESHSSRQAADGNIEP